MEGHEALLTGRLILETRRLVVDRLRGGASGGANSCRGGVTVELFLLAQRLSGRHGRIESTLRSGDILTRTTTILAVVAVTTLMAIACAVEETPPANAPTPSRQVESAASPTATPTPTANPPRPTPPPGRQPLEVSPGITLESPSNFNGAYLYSRLSTTASRSRTARSIGGRVTLLGDGSVHHCSFLTEEGRRELEAVLSDGALMAKIRAQLARWGLVGKPVELPMALWMDDVPEALSQPASFRIHLGSHSDCPVTYPNGVLEFDFVITRFDGTLVWRRPRPILSEDGLDLTLVPGEERTYEATWDLKDEQGRPVPEGAYWLQGYVNVGPHAGAEPVTRVVGLKKLIFVGPRLPLTHWLDIGLQTQSKPYPGVAARFTVEVQNTSSEPVQIWHGREPFDFVVLGPDGTEVWRWSRWRVVLDDGRHTALALGETVQFAAVWDGHDQDCQPDPNVGGMPCRGSLVSPGQYTVLATFEGALSDVYSGYIEKIEVGPVELTIAP